MKSFGKFGLSLAVVSVLGIGFVGCGGGGGSDSSTPTVLDENIKEVQENTTPTIQLGEANSDIVSYSISGTDASYFNIDTTNGLVTFKTAPDYETKSVYYFDATAINTSNQSASYTVQINILDVEESTDSTEISDDTKAVLYALANEKIGLLNSSSVSDTSTRSLRGVIRDTNTDDILFSLANTSLGFSQELYEELVSDSDLVAEINKMENKAQFANNIYNVVEKSLNEEPTPELFFEYLDIVAELAPAGVQEAIEVYSTTSKQLLKDIKDLNAYGGTFQKESINITFENQEGDNYDGEISDIKVYYIVDAEGTTSYGSGHSTTKSGDKYILSLTNIMDIKNKILIEYTVNGKTLKSPYILGTSEDITIVVRDTPPIVKASCELNNYTGELTCINETIDNGKKLTSDDSGYNYSWYLNGDNIEDSDSFNGYYTYTSKGAYGITLFVEDSAGNNKHYMTNVNYDPTSIDIDFFVDKNIQNEYKEGNNVTFLISTEAYNQIESYQWSMAKPNSIQTTLLGTDISETIENLEAGNYKIYLTITDVNGKDKTESFEFVSESTTEEQPTYTNNNFTYSTITSSVTGKIWMDRNLGASRACTSFDDTQCYGDY
ncbi:MAG: hypothetical protein U9N59_07325, partial [Campylobacterota bacterium]|nr:hypothetical protein [Campylobacterota bacterium]